MLAGRSLKYYMQKQKIDDILIVNNLRVNFNIKNENIFKKNTVLTAVDNISFTIKKGKTLGLVGESGCGKTTTGQAILGLIQTTAGKICFEKEDITNISYKEFLPKRHKIQIIFQDPYSSLNPRQTAEEIIRDPLDIHNIGNNKERINKVKELMKLVGLRENQMKLYPHQFSGGQRQRICIARALALNPDFIVCDEPVSALDVAIQAQILNLLKKLQKELNLTYLFISHDLAVVQHISDEIAVMYLGSIVEKTNNIDLFNKPKHPYTKALLSSVLNTSLDTKKERIRLIGDVPNPLNKPTGCSFHTRCTYAKDKCKSVKPDFIEKENGHWVACHENL
tara:strand:- start:154 stop:1164 length:1011 start_codon:yes stop_codon:yes gene_type:complete